MNNDLNFFNTTIRTARFPAPSPDLFERIISGTHAAPRFLMLKASALISMIAIAAFAAGFMQSPFHTHGASSPYYAGSGLYLLNYLG